MNGQMGFPGIFSSPAHADFPAASWLLLWTEKGRLD